MVALCRGEGCRSWTRSSPTPPRFLGLVMLLGLQFGVLGDKAVAGGSSCGWCVDKAKASALVGRGDIGL